MVEYGFFLKFTNIASAFFIYSHLLTDRSHHKYSVADLYLKPFKLNSIDSFFSKTPSCNYFFFRKSFSPE